MGCKACAGIKAGLQLGHGGVRMAGMARRRKSVDEGKAILLSLGLGWKALSCWGGTESGIVIGARRGLHG